MMGRTLVVGATGKVGREVVAGLTARGEAVRGASRDPARAGHLLPPATEVVEFDYDRPETFRRALETVDCMFMSVRPGDEAADATAGPLVDEAVRRGVRHIVTLTAMGAERVPDNALRRIERQVEASGATWTHLRPNFFMQIFAVPPLVQQLRAVHSLRVPAADARLSFVDVRDVGAVAVVALLDGRHSGKAYTLTGGEAIDHGAVTRAISRATSQAFNYVPIGEEEARHLMAAGGLPPRRVERLLGFYGLVRAGACAELSPDVASVLGRPPIGFDRFARDYSTHWGEAGSEEEVRTRATV
jgi:uncharacterized protein YbjT (DUF2867 family)